MRKILSLIAFGTIIVALSACGNKKGTEEIDTIDSTARIEVDSTTIIVSEDTVVKTDTVQVQAPAADSASQPN